MQERVSIVSDRQQVFLGKTYWKCGFYFQRYGKRLHRVVYQHHNGDIPKGCHVHHKDGDRSNNQPENLELMSNSRHMSLHMQERPPMGFTQVARDAAAKWHGSEHGAAWHAQHYEKFKHRLHEIRKYTCEQCGKEYEAMAGKNRFCSNNCKSAHRRASGVDNIERACVVCGKIFVCDKYSAKKSCSRKCGSLLGGNSRRKE